MQTNFKKDVYLEIENPSDTEAEILLRKITDNQIDFDSISFYLLANLNLFF
jgi:hypothetical protein